MFQLLREKYFKRHKAFTQTLFCFTLTKPLYGMQMKLHLFLFFFFKGLRAEAKLSALGSYNWQLAEPGHDIQVPDLQNQCCFLLYSTPSSSQLHPQAPLGLGMAQHMKWSKLVYGKQLGTHIIVVSSDQLGHGCTPRKSILLILGVLN